MSDNRNLYSVFKYGNYAPAFCRPGQLPGGCFKTLDNDRATNGVLNMTFNAASRLAVCDIYTLFPDGLQRKYAAQYIVNGEIV